MIKMIRFTYNDQKLNNWLTHRTFNVFNALKEPIYDLMIKYIKEKINIDEEYLEYTMGTTIIDYGKKYLKELFRSPTFNSEELISDWNLVIDGLKSDVGVFNPLEYNKLVETIYMSLLNPIIEYKLKLTQLRDLNDKAIDALGIPEQYMKKAIIRYKNRWDQKIKDNNLKRPKDQTTREYIFFNIVGSETNSIAKSKDQIDDLIITMRTEPLSELYDYYLQEHNKKLSRKERIINIKLPEDINEFIKGSGYKSKDKIVALIKKGYGDKTYINLPNYPINKFPLKENKKKYTLHFVAPRYSYMIDLMFENRKYCYLIAININTRKLWVENTNIKTSDDDFERAAIKCTENIIDAFYRMMERGMKVKYVKGDNDKSFNSVMAKRFFKENEIQFFGASLQKTKYPNFMKKLNMVKAIKPEPLHSSLSLVDRVIRTIRDLAYNMQIGEITPKIMKRIEWIYNNAPHKTLSKYAGIQVTPDEVDNDEELESFINRRIRQDNYNIVNSYGFNIPEGSKVSVYNERNDKAKRRSEIQPGNYTILKRNGNLYEIMDEDGNVETKSRTKINPISTL